MIKLKEGFFIGSEFPPVVIAEIGSNQRSLSDCLKAIEISANVGADIVKFQLFTHEALYGLPGILQGSILPEWLPELKKCADLNNIEFACSAFSEELYSLVDPFVNIHKVASAECTHIGILETLSKLKKPVILSTGAHTEEEISQALNTFTIATHSKHLKWDLHYSIPIILMYCVAAYPTHSVDLYKINHLRHIYGLPIGFSDHTLSFNEIPVSAIYDHGACVLEKHFNPLNLSSPDSGHSLDTPHMRSLISSIKRTEHLNKFSQDEEDMIYLHNRRLIVTERIPVGGSFKYNQNFGIYRSKKRDVLGLAPHMRDRVEGKIAKYELFPGDSIRGCDVSC